MIRSLPIFAVAAAALCGGCIIVQPPPGSAAQPTSAPAATTTVATPTAAPAPAAARAPATPTTVEVHNDCGRTVNVFYGDKPKFGSGTKSAIGANTTTSASRKPDGTLEVWIITDNEDPIASATVTATTRRVTIDRSCNALVAQ
jgi:hypothetical protein